MPTALLAHDPGQVGADVPFFAASDISGIKGGSLVRWSEAGRGAV